MVGVSHDAPDDNRAFRAKFDFPYDLLSDTDLSMSAAYGAAGAGSSNASRVSVLVGPDGTVAASWGKVSPADHPAEVLAELERLGAG